MYDMYGKQGADAADQMPGGGMGGMGGMGGFPGGMPGGMGGFGGMPGGMHFSTTGGPGGGGGGGHGMSPEDAQRLFGSIFGGSDPFGGAGMFGGGGSMGGMPGGIHMNMGGGGMPGGMDPISMMFGGGMPGGMGGMGGMPGMGGMGGMPGGMPGGMRRPQSQPQTKRYDTIPRGTVVSLKGLVSAPERNGDQGIIQQYNASSGRYIVLLGDEDEAEQQQMSVKPSNLLQHVHVRIHDVKSQPELNGKTGTIVTWIAAKERYNIHVPALNKVVSLRPANVVLDKGIVGQICGLSSKPELNGKWGTIKDWVRESNKYDVQLSASQVIRIKVENLRV